MKEGEEEERITTQSDNEPSDFDNSQSLVWNLWIIKSSSVTFTIKRKYLFKLKNRLEHKAKAVKSHHDAGREILQINMLVYMLFMMKGTEQETYIGKEGKK